MPGSSSGSTQKYGREVHKEFDRRINQAGDTGIVGETGFKIGGLASRNGNAWERGTTAPDAVLGTDRDKPIALFDLKVGLLVLSSEGSASPSATAFTVAPPDWAPDLHVATSNPFVVAVGGLGMVVDQHAQPQLARPVEDHLAEARRLIAAGPGNIPVLLEWVASLDAAGLDRPRLAAAADALAVEVATCPGHTATERRRDRIAELARSDDEEVERALRATAAQNVVDLRLTGLDTDAIPFPGTTWGGA